MKTNSITSRVLKLALPLATSRALNMLTLFLGTLFVTRLGHDVLAASALMTAIQAFFFVAGCSLLFALAPVVGHSFGAKRYEEAGSYLQQGLVLAAIISAILMLILWHLGPILLHFGQPPKITAIVAKYFHVYMWSIPGLLGQMTFQQFMTATNRQNVALSTTIVSLIMMIFFAQGLVYGDFGLPRCGVQGLGYTYTIISTTILIIYLLYTGLNRSFRHYKIYQLRIIKTFPLMKKVLSVGWPITVQLLADLGCFLLINIMVGWVSINALAANQIVTQYFMLLVVPVFALAQASSILIGQAIGSEQTHEIRKIGSTVVLMGVVFTFFIMILFTLFPKVLIAVYTSGHAPKNLETETLAKTVLILTGLRLMLDAISEINIGSLRGLLDTRAPMLIIFVTYWVLDIPLSYLFGFTIDAGLKGITWAGIVSTAIAAVWLFFRWHKKSKTFMLENTTSS